MVFGTFSPLERFSFHFFTILPKDLQAQKYTAALKRVHIGIDRVLKESFPQNREARQSERFFRKTG